jgi:cbb3-type cytochrome oxidase subunit 3
MNFSSPFTISVILLSIVFLSIIFYSFQTKDNKDFDELAEIFQDMPDEINKSELEKIFEKEPLQEKYLKIIDQISATTVYPVAKLKMGSKILFCVAEENFGYREMSYGLHMLMIDKKSLKINSHQNFVTTNNEQSKSEVDENVIIQKLFDSMTYDKKEGFTFYEKVYELRGEQSTLKKTEIIKYGINSAKKIHFISRE